VNKIIKRKHNSYLNKKEKKSIYKVVNNVGNSLCKNKWKSTNKMFIIHKNSKKPGKFHPSMKNIKSLLCSIIINFKIDRQPPIILLF
jgi:hypothetical protein